jgi:soluble lytic murein transglycosylase-like protein
MKRSVRLPFTVLSTILSLAFALRPAPSDPAIIELRPLHGSRFHAFHPGDLTATPQGVPQRFQLFPRSASGEQQRRFLRDLPYGSAMALAAARHRVDGLLVAAIVEAESGFVPDRVSPAGAMGLMQVLPSTAEEYGAEDLLDPHVNLDVGSRYLGELIADFGGNLELAVAAYNAGPGAVERYGGVPPYPETRDYVKRVLTLYGEHHQTAGADRDPFSAPGYRFGA